MARMHSRKKGNARSTRPAKTKAPTWVRYKKTEIEMIVSKLAKDDKSPSEIGMILRDTYGIPDAKEILEKSITEFLKEKKLAKSLPEDLLALIKKAIEIRKHLDKNKKDMTAKRGMQLTESKIGRLTKYYKKNSVIESSWKYDPATARMHLE